MKKFTSLENEYTALLSLFSSPNLKIKDNEDNSFDILIKSPQGINSIDDFDTDIFVVSAINVNSIYLPKQLLSDDSSGTDHNNDVEVLVANKISNISFTDVYDKNNTLSAISCKVSEDMFKTGIKDLIYSTLYLTSRASYARSFEDRDTKEVVTDLFNQHLPMLERFSDMNKMFGIYARTRLRGEIEQDNSKHTYYIPNSNLSEIAQDALPKSNDFDFILNSQNNYARDIVFSDIFTKLSQNTPEQLYKALDVDSLNFHSRASKKYTSIKAGIVNESLVYDGK